MNEYKHQILEVLKRANQPMDVQKIKEAVGIGNWNTALKHLLELKLEGKVEGQKTTKSWIFWVKRKGDQDGTG